MARQMIKVTVEYKFPVDDAKAAHMMVDLLKQYGTGMGSDGYSIWEWSPEETVIEAVVE